MATAENNALTIRRSVDTAPATSPFSSDREAFANAQRIATALASSTIVPEAYRGEKGMPNVLVAMEYAHRIGASVLAVMQNMDVIHGRPGLRATFLIGTVNACGRFTPIRFRWIGERGKDSWGCIAHATDRESGDVCEGPEVTIETAKAEGWYSKAGSKWKTIPQLMLMYRAAAWWTRVYSPELSLGLHTTDEIEDFGDAAPAPQLRAINVARALDAGDVTVDEEGTVDEQQRRTAGARELFDHVLTQRRPDIAGDLMERAQLIADVCNVADEAQLTVNDYTRLTQYVESLPAKS